MISSVQELTVTNLLDSFVHVEVIVDCRELRHSSPLAQVIPPRANANIPLVFESTVKGTFHRSDDVFESHFSLIRFFESSVKGTFLRLVGCV